MMVSILGAATVSLALLAAFFLWKFLEAKAARALVETQVKLLEARLSERALQEETLRQTARFEFEQLAARIVEKESERLRVAQHEMRETSEKGLERLLAPFKERLQEFEKRVHESYQTEGRERHVLKAEIERLVGLNERMAEEANHLTQALKGDSKFQGDWGEMVLERILEASGLREGTEYVLQQSLKNGEGDRFRPDVLIQLPDGKQIIIDSKVSLTAYEAHGRLGEAGLAEERERFMREHIASFDRHVNDLAERHYPKLKGLKTPEFVFLFTPIEAAYVMAMRHDPMLATRAWHKGVAIVTSTTLFTSLKTVASIWRLEHQNRNAQEIADEAAKLYDKFVGFHEDFEKVGRALESGLNQYEEARRKLRDGPGNVFRKIDLLRELGAAPTKRIKPELLE